MLSPKQLRCVELLASEIQQKDIAKELGVSERTIQRWLKLDEFRDALQGVSYCPVVISAVEVVSSHKSRRERLNRLVDASIDMLEAVIKDNDSRVADKIRAAALIGDWQGISKLPDYESALMTLSEYGWLPDEVVESARQASVEFQGKVQKAIASDISNPCL